MTSLIAGLAHAGTGDRSSPPYTTSPVMPVAVVAMAAKGEGNPRGWVAVVVRITVDYRATSFVVMAVKVTVMVMAVEIMPVAVVAIVIVIAGLSSRSKEGGDDRHAPDKNQFWDIHHKDSKEERQACHGGFPSVSRACGCPYGVADDDTNVADGDMPWVRSAPRIDSRIQLST